MEAFFILLFLSKNLDYFLNCGMPIAIQELSKSLIFKNVYLYKGGLLMYEQIHETEESARKVAFDKGDDKYLYTVAIEVIKLPND